MSYPRPQFSRADWQSLNGSWNYSFSHELNATSVDWQGKIAVPFPPESQLSGVHDESFHPVIWYQRTFSIKDSWQGRRIHLHFGAVDYRARVWVNDQLVATHEGGHTPFHADITDALIKGEQTVTVRAEDDPFDLSQPRGKQDWQENPHRIWYPRTTGIWQAVWLEPVAETYISKLRMTPNLSDFSIHTEVQLSGNVEGLSLELEFRLGDEILAADTLKPSQLYTWQNQLSRSIKLAVNGFDDLLDYIWSPESPTLIDVTLKLKRDDDVLDEVTSYTALRSVGTKDGQFLLNGRPYFLRLALDQGYWDESLLAAPNDEALKKDVELAKAMGFNGVRKHQKIEDPRYLYWADKLGLLVWEEMPSPYTFTPEAINRVTKEWLEVIERDYNHPCIVTWVCFNESWGVMDLQTSALQRNFVAGLYHLTKALDGSRPVIGNDGWEHVETDLLSIHDYSHDAAVLEERYGTPEASMNTCEMTLEHGRAILLDDTVLTNQPVLLTEFGGIRFNPEVAEGWGYQEVKDEESLLEIYATMIRAISGRGLAGFCYTQFADTFQEQNGLLYSDRRPKLALDALSKATRGGR